MTDLVNTAYSKGHGTGNDFVLLTDPEGLLDLPAERVAQWCDRHQGIGGDGLIRAVRTAALPDGADLAAQEPRAEWFMDYRNHDGSVAEMCGNGVRAFIHHLRKEGLVSLDIDDELIIGTRAGLKTVTRVSAEQVVPGESNVSASTTPDLGTVDYYAVDLGPWRLEQPETAQAQGSDALVHADGLDVPRPALSINMGNPHTVLALAHESELADLGLHRQPQVEPHPVAGTNVEFVVPSDLGAQDGVGAISMRVFERGVGETQSCGTGAAAAAAAVRFWGGPESPDEWLVHVPGGTVRVSFRMGEDGLEHAILSGPAVIVAQGAAAI
jgi:diaminopimelate epimerase